MVFANLYQQLVSAGLPVNYATDSGEVSFSRTLTPAEDETYLAIISPSSAAAKLRVKNSRINVKNIPNWATWNENDALAYIDANTGNVQQMRAVVRDMARLLIALRDATWPDLSNGNTIKDL